MGNFRFEFDHGAKKTACPECGHRTWRTLRDAKTKEECDPRYGRCERINACQHQSYPPFEGREDFVPLPRIRMTPPKRTDWRCPPHIVEMTKDSRGNVFAKWLVGIWGERAKEALRTYRVGTMPPSDKRPDLSGCIVWWQIGSDGLHRSGKIMKYGPDGKRVKEFGSKWMHSILCPTKSMEDLGCAQVLFGEHLLADRPQAIVALCESEKSAVICSIQYPQYVWVATGGADNFSVSMCMSLSGRDVVVVPDVGCYEKWSQKAMDIEVLCNSMVVSDYLEVSGLPQGEDIADLILGGEDFIFPQQATSTEATEPPYGGYKDQFQYEINQPVSPVDKLLSRPGIQSLVAELDLDIDHVTIKPYKG